MGDLSKTLELLMRVKILERHLNDLKDKIEMPNHNPCMVCSLRNFKNNQDTQMQKIIDELEMKELLYLYNCVQSDATWAELEQENAKKFADLQKELASNGQAISTDEPTNESDKIYNAQVMIQQHENCETVNASNRSCADVTSRVNKIGSSHADNVDRSNQSITSKVESESESANLQKEQPVSDKQEPSISTDKDDPDAEQAYYDRYDELNTPKFSEHSLVRPNLAQHLEEENIVMEINLNQNQSELKTVLSCTDLTAQRYLSNSDDIDTTADDSKQYIEGQSKEIMSESAEIVSCEEGCDCQCIGEDDEQSMSKIQGESERNVIIENTKSVSESECQSTDQKERSVSNEQDDAEQAHCDRYDELNTLSLDADKFNESQNCEKANESEEPADNIKNNDDELKETTDSNIECICENDIENEKQMISRASIEDKSNEENETNCDVECNATSSKDNLDIQNNLCDEKSNSIDDNGKSNATSSVQSKDNVIDKVSSKGEENPNSDSYRTASQCSIEGQNQCAVGVEINVNDTDKYSYASYPHSDISRDVIYYDDTHKTGDEREMISNTKIVTNQNVNLIEMKKSRPSYNISKRSSKGSKYVIKKRKLIQIPEGSTPKNIIDFLISSIHNKKVQTAPLILEIAENIIKSNLKICHGCRSRFNIAKN